MLTKGSSVDLSITQVIAVIRITSIAGFLSTRHFIPYSRRSQKKVNIVRDISGYNILPVLYVDKKLLSLMAKAFKILSTSDIMV